MKYPIIQDGQWVKPRLRNYRMMCCECKAVHSITFQIIRRGKRNLLFFKATRLPKSTAQARRRRKPQ